MVNVTLNLTAQQSVSASAPSDLVFKRTVNRVIVDVVVTDSYGKPAHGLNAQDFIVKENGDPQRILSFDVHDFETAYAPPKLRDLPPKPPARAIAPPVGSAETH